MAAENLRVTPGTLRSSATWPSISIPIMPLDRGIEKIVRNEIFKEIWSEIERLYERVSTVRFARASASSAALRCDSRGLKKK